jgi:serine/threonine protein kinase/WD40 repeat protein
MSVPAQDEDGASAFDTATRALEVYARLRDALCVLPASARKAAIDAAVDQPAVRTEVLRLASLAGLDEPALRASQYTPTEPPSYPQAPVPPASLAPSAPHDELEPGGLLAQRYRIIRKVGEGGVGVVYLANQESPVKRQVAIKVLPSEVAGPRAELRFEAERNALSRMNHPFVASIYDAGRTRQGRLFVVMEFVDGEPIDTFCTRQALTVRERAELFVKVCRGVHHAHQKGIIHRDIKPGNVLVALREGIAVPKIIDFGIAKVSSHQSSPRTTVTGFFVGTPEYMSPEQAGVGGGDVDTISDVYSLGVLFYELLTGLLPLTRGGDDAHITDWQRTLATIDPVKPSQRLSQALLSREVTFGVVHPRELAGDLDSIVMKALSRERDRRYSSASELAADVERHLAAENVLARPPSLAYRLARFSKRHPALVAATAVLTVSALIGSLIISGISADRAEQRRQAEAAQLRAETERELARAQSKIAEEMTARSHLSTARVAFEVHDAATAKVALDSIPEPFRGWEWRWLRYEIDRSTATTRQAYHHGAVKHLGLVAFDSLLVSAGDDGTLRIWDALDLSPQGLVQVSPTPILGLAVGEHPLGPIALVTHDEGLTAYDLETLGPLWTLGPGTRISREAISFDGTRALVASGVRDVAMLDAYTGAPLGPVEAEVPRIEQAGFLVDDLVYVDAGQFSVVLEGKTVLATLHGLSPTVSPARDRIGMRPWNQWHDRKVLDARTGIELGWIRAAEIVRHYNLAPDNGVTTTEKTTTITIRPQLDRVNVLEAQSELIGRTIAQGGPIGSELARQGGVVLAGHRAVVKVIQYGRLGDAVFSGGDNGRIKRWEATLTKTPFAITGTNDVVFGADFSRDTERVVTTGWGMVKVWDARVGRELASRWWSRAYVTGVSFSPDGRRFVAADWKGEVGIFDAETASLLTRWPSVGAVAKEVLWTEDGIFLATVGGEMMRLSTADGSVLWRRLVHSDTPVGALVRTPPRGHRDLLFSCGSLEDALPETDTLAHKRPSAHPFVRALDPATGELVPLLEEARGPFSALAVRPDGSELVAGSEDGTIVVWSLEDGRIRIRRSSVGGRIDAITWSPTQRRILLAYATGVVVVADAQSLSLLLTLPGAPSGVRDLEVSPDGRALLLAGQGAPVVAYEASARIDPKLRAHWHAVRRELDQLLTHLPSVTHLLGPETDPDLAALARARGDNPNQLNSQAWAVVRYPGEAPAVVAFARQQAETAADLASVWQFENTRALARFRDGDLEGALRSVERSVTLQVEVGLTTHPSDWATAAMALHRLGRLDEARAKLAMAIAESELPPWRGDSEIGALVNEARELLGP